MITTRDFGGCKTGDTCASLEQKKKMRLLLVA